MSEKATHQPRSWLSEQILAVFHQAGIEPLLEQGLDLVRKGKILDFSVISGTMSIRVQAERYSPVTAELQIAPFSDEQWADIFRELSGQALFFAKLLAGELPPEIQNVLSRLNLELFPSSTSELALKCGCSKKSALCVHLAAMYFLINEKFHENPLLMFTLRGRTKQEALTELRKLRRENAQWRDAEVKQLFSTADYSAAPSLSEAIDSFWSSGEALQQLRFTIRADELPGAILRQLTAIPTANRGLNIENLLEQAYIYIANRAQAFGLGLTKSSPGM